MKVRLIRNANITGTANRFNTSSTNEVIIGYDEEDGDVDSVYISDLEVLVNKVVQAGFCLKLIKVWIPLSEAFKNHDIITDDLNTEFFEPRTKEDRKRGYTL